jgi:hypothetical protein
MIAGIVIATLAVVSGGAFVVVGLIRQRSQKRDRDQLMESIPVDEPVSEVSAPQVIALSGRYT